jgi:hypothetical protein
MNFVRTLPETKPELMEDLLSAKKAHVRTRWQLHQMDGTTHLPTKELEGRGVPIELGLPSCCASRAGLPNIPIG